MAQSANSGKGCGYLVSGILIAIGLAVIWSAQSAYRRSEDVVSVLVAAGFGLLMVAAGFGIVRPIRRHAQKQERLKRMRAEFPNEPWRWKSEWSGAAIETSDRAGLWMIWIFAIFWSVGSFAAAIAVALQENVEGPAYFVFLFPVIGVGLLYAAIHKTIQVRKYGRVLFVPSTMPGAIGGYLGGVIQVPARVAIESDARLALKCVRRITTGSGKNRSTRENVMWEREERIPREKWAGDAAGTEIPVLFHIPEGSEASDDSDSNNELIWRLSASAETPGVDFDCTFVVPVLVTGETAPPPENNRPALDTYSGAPPDEAALRRAGVTRQAGRYRFSSSHMTGSRIVFSLIVLVVLGILVAFWSNDVPFIAWFVVLVFGAIFFFAALDLWVGGCEVSIEPADVVVRRGGLFGEKELRVPRADVARIEINKSMSAGNTEYYRLKFIGREGVDPAAAAAGEHFQARKLRHRLARAAKGQGNATEIRAAMARTPRFAVEFAKHIPGRANSQTIADMVMAEIRK